MTFYGYFISPVQTRNNEPSVLDYVREMGGGESGLLEGGGGRHKERVP